MDRKMSNPRIQKAFSTFPRQLAFWTKTAQTTREQTAYVKFAKKLDHE
jgi:hypothetical protein